MAFRFICHSVLGLLVRLDGSRQSSRLFSSLFPWLVPWQAGWPRPQQYYIRWPRALPTRCVASESCLTSSPWSRPHWAGLKTNGHPAPPSSRAFQLTGLDRTGWRGVVRACVRACARACVGGGADYELRTEMRRGTGIAMRMRGYVGVGGRG